MTTEKLFTVCGTSTANGTRKVRFANDTARVKVLAKNGHTDITLIELPAAMTKTDAVAFIKTLPEFASEADQLAIGEHESSVAEKPASKRKARTNTATAESTVEDTSDDDQPIGLDLLEPALL